MKKFISVVAMMFVSMSALAASVDVGVLRVVQGDS